jgi:hypothetical protein
MKTRLATTLLFVASIAAIGSARADCAGSNITEVRAAYARAQAFERNGDNKSALAAYVAAQDYICAANPVEADAARRAAALSLPLAAAAEKTNDFGAAFDFYEAGGHYSRADAALIAHARAHQDDPAVFDKVYHVLAERSSPAFRENNNARLNTTGAYQPNAQYLAEVLAMPKKGVERALQREAAAFNEQYLREYVQLIQSRPDDPTDMAAVQRLMGTQQAFARKYPNEPLKESRAALAVLRSWSLVTPNAAEQKIFDAQHQQRIQQRADTLLKSYSAAPAFVEAAMDYYSATGFEQDVVDARLSAIKAQAMKLADEANLRQRLTLAAEYYSLAGADDKAQAARDRQRQLAMSKMQPQIDAAQRQAEEMRKQFSDPATVEAMRAQAEAARRSFAAQKHANAKTSKQGADDLEKELGL